MSFAPFNMNSSNQGKLKSNVSKPQENILAGVSAFGESGGLSAYTGGDSESQQPFQQGLYQQSPQQFRQKQETSMYKRQSPQQSQQPQRRVQQPQRHVQSPQKRVQQPQINIKEMEELLKKPILFYSSFCKHSSVFMEGLKKHPMLFKNFVKVPIDPNPQTKQRPKLFYDLQVVLKQRIKSVPTIIVEEGQYVLTDKEAFKWLEFNLQKDRETIKGFSLAEMNAFSDKYADFGSSPISNMMDDQHVQHQNFHFLNEQIDHIMTPAEGDPKYERNPNAIKQERGQMDTLISDKQKRMGKLDFSEDYSRGGITTDNVNQIESQRGYEGGPPQIKKTAIDFTNPNIGYAGQAGGSVNKTGQVFQTQKLQEMDSKLEQMRLERESFGTAPSNQSASNVKVDFQSGQIMPQN